VLWCVVCVVVCGVLGRWVAMEGFCNRELSTRTRTALFHGTTVSAEIVLAMNDEEINFEFLLCSGVKATNLVVGGVGPAALKARGACNAKQLRKLGFNSLHLCDASFCNEANFAFGAADVVDAFLVTAEDAVAVSGCECAHILGVSVNDLLIKCCGFPGEASAVLQQLPKGAALHDVSCNVVLDAGLRANSLANLGYGLASVVAQLGPTGSEITRLGFVL